MTEKEIMDILMELLEDQNGKKYTYSIIGEEDSAELKT